MKEKNKQNIKKGFTLIELLVVVLIIGILAAIALPQYKMAVGKAKFATLKDSARAIRNALDRYYLVNSNYTTSLGNLDVEVSSELGCYINPHTNPMIMCRRTILGTTIGFMLGYDYRQRQQACFVLYDVTNINANKLCQAETGIVTPQEDGGSLYKAYYWYR